MDELSAFFDTETGTVAIAVRMLTAAVFGAIIGFDREYLERPAGMRTHILVALAAATFAIVTLELMARATLEGKNADPIRVIEAVTAGVAFLAAGTIIFSRGRVHGLTTGAGLWLAGAVGVACGVGYFFIALLATALATFVLVVLRWVEAAMPQSKRRLDAKDGNATDEEVGADERP